MKVKRATGTFVIVIRFDPMENRISNARVAGNVGVFVGSPEMVNKMIGESLAGLADNPEYALEPKYKGWDGQEYPQVLRKEVPVWIAEDFESEAELEES